MVTLVKGLDHLSALTRSCRLLTITFYRWLVPLTFCNGSSLVFATPTDWMQHRARRAPIFGYAKPYAGAPGDVDSSAVSNVSVGPRIVFRDSQSVTGLSNHDKGALALTLPLVT